MLSFVLFGKVAIKMVAELRTFFLLEGLCFKASGQSMFYIYIVHYLSDLLNYRRKMYQILITKCCVLYWYLYFFSRWRLYIDFFTISRWSFPRRIASLFTKLSFETDASLQLKMETKKVMTNLPPSEILRLWKLCRSVVFIMELYISILSRMQKETCSGLGWRLC